MKHTEEYLQAKWVIKNPDGYDERDVVDAKRYCNAYLDGYNQALRTPDIVGQSEQLRAFKEFLKSKYHLPISNRMVDEFENSSNIGEFRQEPNITLKQAIAKAKTNLDKITDVDKFLDDIR